MVSTQIFTVVTGGHGGLILAIPNPPGVFQGAVWEFPTFFSENAMDHRL